MSSNFRTRVLLEDILKIYNPRGFGFICQLILGFTFIDLGFKILEFKLSGRPDMIVKKDTEVYAIEVKAPVENDVVFAKEDIEGVIETNYKPLLAILSYPEADVKWIIIDAKLMRPGKFNKISLERYSIKQIENDVSNAFPCTFEKYYEIAKSYGIKNLHNVLKKGISS